MEETTFRGEGDCSTSVIADDSLRVYDKDYYVGQCLVFEAHFMFTAFRVLDNLSPLGLIIPTLRSSGESSNIIYKRCTVRFPPSSLEL